MGRAAAGARAAAGGRTPNGGNEKMMQPTLSEHRVDPRTPRIYDAELSDHQELIMPMNAPVVNHNKLNQSQ